MAGTPLPDDKVRKIVEAARKGTQVLEIARTHKIDPRTVRKYLKIYNASEKAQPPPKYKVNQLQDKLEIDGTVEIIKHDRPYTPEEMCELAGVDLDVWIPQYSTVNTWQTAGKFPIPKKFTPAGHVAEYEWKVQDLFQTRVTFKRVIAEELVAAVQRFTKKHVRPMSKPKLGRRREGEYMCSFGIWDAHLGMYAWAQEVGASFDMSIAVARAFNAIDDIMLKLRPYSLERVIMPIGNDFMHYDSVRRLTTFGEHNLDTDTRFGLVYEAGLEALIYSVERFREICDCVEVLYIPGNHDMTPSYCMTSAINQRFLKDPRVKVDIGFCPRKWRTHGGVLIMYDHGQKVPMRRFPSVVMSECKEAISKSTYMEVQVGHKHTEWEAEYEGVIPTNGVTVRRNPSMSNVDKWHYDQGFLGHAVKSCNAWLYDRTAIQHQVFAWARDDDNPVADRRCKL